VSRNTKKIILDGGPSLKSYYCNKNVLKISFKKVLFLLHFSSEATLIPLFPPPLQRGARLSAKYFKAGNTRVI